MIDVAWRIEDEDWDPDVAGPPRPVISTWHFLRNALRRARLTWVGLAVVGGALGLAALVVVPPSTTSTVTVLLAHQAGTDQASAMSTDVSLLRTRAVANSVIDELGLAMTPEDFQASVTAVPATNQILELTVSGPDGPTAVARAQALVASYLDFRNAQLRSLAKGFVDGSKGQVANLQDQVDELTREYNQLSGSGAAAQAKATDILAQRAELDSQITTLQRGVEDATLQTDAAIASTHVIDEPRADPHSTRKAAVLYIGSGVIGGAALGIGIVVFRALTSDRLRRRQEVAVALAMPVRVSVDGFSPPGRLSRMARWVRRRLAAARWAPVAGIVQGRPRRMSWLRARSGSPAGEGTGQVLGGDLETLVHGLETVVLHGDDDAVRRGEPSGDAPDGPVTVGLAAVGNADVGALVVLALGTRLHRLGVPVFLVDLSSSGAMVAVRSDSERRTEWADGHPAESDPDVFRPSGVPGLAKGPASATRPAVVNLREEEQLRTAWDECDLVLALVEIDPGLDVGNLTSWVDRVVPLVTAGQSSAELLETVGELARAAGLDLPFAMLVGADETDESPGLPETPESAPERTTFAGQR